MKDGAQACRYEMVYAVQLKGLQDDLNELKERVSRLENTLARGVMLLIANLVGVLMMLAGQVIKF